MKGDVPTFILNDVTDRLDKGETEIVIPMVLSLRDKGVLEYLNEYHEKKDYSWKLDFLDVAFDHVAKRIDDKLSSYKDIDVEILNMSDTDRRINITLRKKEIENDE